MGWLRVGLRPAGRWLLLGLARFFSPFFFVLFSFLFFFPFIFFLLNLLLNNF